MGFKVCGVDRTAGYLETARSQSPDIEYVQSDMRQFYRDDAFDAVLSMFTAFGYFEDPDEDLQVLRNVHRSLRPGGRFLLELMGKEILARIFQPRDWFEQGDLLVAVERRLEQDWSWIQSRHIVIRGTERHEFVYSNRVYSATELRHALESVGFRSRPRLRKPEWKPLRRQSGAPCPGGRPLMPSSSTTIRRGAIQMQQSFRMGMVVLFLLSAARAGLSPRSRSASTSMVSTVASQTNPVKDDSEQQAHATLLVALLQRWDRRHRHNTGRHPRRKWLNG